LSRAPRADERGNLRAGSLSAGEKVTADAGRGNRLDGPLSAMEVGQRARAGVTPRA
jgi:hypothetical protein